MPVINTNVNAIIARNAGAVNDRSMTKAMQSLSTGKRINVASDDAAGLAIATKMTSQIRGLDQAVRNANDGISMLQVVEGATVEMTNMLQRMRELAVQSANDTNTDAERSYLNDEFTQLRAEINRIAETTQWNGQYIMDGSGSVGTASSDYAGTQVTVDDVAGGSVVQFQVGANADETIDFQIGSFLTGATAGTDATTATAASKAYTFTAAGITAATGYDYIELSSATDGNTITLIDGSSTAQTEAHAALTAALADGTDADLWATLATKLQAAADENTAGANLVITSTGASNITITDSSITTTGGTNDWLIDLTVAADGSSVLTAATDYTATDTAAVAGDAAVAGVNGIFADAGLDDLDISDQSGSQAAITALGTATTALNEARSAMGATINRLTYAGDNLTNISANVNAARSRVLDTDYAQATTELARTQIIQQASTAMLAQANQGAQSVLSLLK